MILMLVVHLCLCLGLCLCLSLGLSLGLGLCLGLGLGLGLGLCLGLSLRSDSVLETLLLFRLETLEEIFTDRVETLHQALCIGPPFAVLL